MSCNCNGCGQPERLCRCPKGNGEAPKRAYIAECTDCDPCRPCESMVKICSFVTPTLTEGQKFRNSFVYNQEDDSVYYISDDGTPTRFGSSPMFINAFNPDDRKIPRQTVFDFANQKAYIYNPEGDYITVNLNTAPVGPKHLEISYSSFDEPSSAYGAPGALVSSQIFTDIMFYRKLVDPVFSDETTGTELSIAQVFNGLENGAEYVFDSVPLAYKNIGGLGPFGAGTCSNVKLESVVEGEGYKAYVGSAVVFATDNDSTLLGYNMTWGIVRLDGEDEYEYELIVQTLEVS